MIRLLALVLAAAVATAPMTNEEVVRLVAAGSPEREILDAIAARPPAFDLSEDMLAELKLAGVPDAVIAAMRARQAATAPPAPPAAPAPRRGHVRLTVALGGARTLELPKRVPDAVAGRLKLPAGEDALAVHDVAVFLTCATPEHVPDQWRSKSPLGRDLEGTQRHEMLRFVAGDTPAGAKPALTLPVEIDAEVDDLEPHDLVLGVAARIGDRWRTLALDRMPKVEAEAPGKRLAGTIRATGAFGFRVELTAAQSASETSLETPASSIVTP